MNANEMTFGIEIETVAPDSAIQNDGLRIGGYHAGIQVPYLPAGWKAERDGSIDASRGGHACEIVSPILRGAEGLAQVVEVVKTLEAKGHRVNISCGVHVHVGWSRNLPAEALARLVTITAYCEAGLYAITGTKSRERGRYCGGVRKYGNGKDAKPVLDHNRYHALNLTNLANGARDTVEFRVFSGSLNPTKVAGWIQVCLGLVERAIATNPAFAVDAREVERPGPSYTVDTLAGLLAASLPPDPWFILSSEALEGFATWRDPERILTLARLCVVPRGAAPGAAVAVFRERFPAAAGRLAILDNPRLAISSTDIRARIRAGRSIRYLVPDGVAELIREYALYTADPALAAESANA